MKKRSSIIMAILACMVLVVGALAMNPTKAEAADSMTVEAGAVEGYAGENVTVNVSVKGNPGVAGLEFRIGYDSEVLELVSATGVKDTIASAPTIMDQSTTFVGYSMADTKDHAGDGVVLTLEFKILDAAAVGETALEVYQTFACDLDMNEITVEASNGSVKVNCKHATTTSEVTTAATCTKDGVKTIKCTACGEVTKTEKIAATGHKMGDYTQTTAPTCTAKGEETATCSVCGEKDTREVAATGHKMGDYKVTTAPTCTDKGVETATCSACGITETREVAATGHKLGAFTQTTAPTCTDKGVETAKCEKCDYTETKDVAALGHKYDTYKIEKDATETEDGLMVRECSVCGDTVETVLPKLGDVNGVVTNTDGSELTTKVVAGKTATFKTDVINLFEGEATVGDTRFVPVSYKIADVETKFADGKYEGEVATTEAGTVEVVVTYARQIYEATGWVDKDLTVEEKVVLTVEAAPAEDDTTAPSTDDKKEDATTAGGTATTPNTGDSVGTRAAVILLVALSAVCAAGFVSRKKGWVR